MKRPDEVYTILTEHGTGMVPLLLLFSPDTDVWLKFQLAPAHAMALGNELMAAAVRVGGSLECNVFGDIPAEGWKPSKDVREDGA